MPGRILREQVPVMERNVWHFRDSEIVKDGLWDFMQCKIFIPLLNPAFYQWKIGSPKKICN